ncbi:UNKNOWN [Stylonychia lemnae]|uniref:IST1 homolog n=1 Tax=Stylonychia lemnae TaxID=5949 RepID=A0A078A758_STYLE|nr:UNKNOWN [Stylonychia lemnae]|eukprot:CDW76626.1 UNKNOWN [Stylonychia lemnae]
MGAEQGKLNTVKIRINIHRGKKLNAIAKKKDDICKHLEAGNEMNAKIWAETLINEENLIPCFDIVSIMCDQLNGRLKTIEKFGPPKDMDQTFRTLCYASIRLEIDELVQVRQQLGKLLGKQFLISADKDEECVNKVVSLKRFLSNPFEQIVAQINIKIPEEGEKIKRLVELAKERNIDYKPSMEAQQCLNDYIDRKGMPNPQGNSGNHHPIPPVYNPPPIQNQQFQPPPNFPPPDMGNSQPPAFLPPGGGMPPSYMQGLPQYMPPSGPGQYPGFQPANQFNQPPALGQPSYNYQYDTSLQPQNFMPQDNNGGAYGGPGNGTAGSGGMDNIDDFEAKLNSLKKM